MRWLRRVENLIINQVVTNADIKNANRLPVKIK